MNSGGLRLTAEGDKAVHESVLPALKAVSAPRRCMGPTGKGFSANISRQLYASTLVAALAEELGIPVTPASHVHELCRIGVNKSDLAGAPAVAEEVPR